MRSNATPQGRSVNNTRGLAKLVVDFPQAYPQKVNFWLSAHLRSAPFRLGVKFGWGDSMPGVISDRAIHYREQAERIHRLANIEIQPRTRARLLELADDYQQLADTKPQKPSAGSSIEQAPTE
jgi:hypothetical protein